MNYWQDSKSTVHYKNFCSSRKKKKIKSPLSFSHLLYLISFLLLLFPLLPSLVWWGSGAFFSARMFQCEVFPSELQVALTAAVCGGAANAPSTRHCTRPPTSFTPCFVPPSPSFLTTQPLLALVPPHSQSGGCSNFYRSRVFFSLCVIWQQKAFLGYDKKLNLYL